MVGVARSFKKPEFMKIKLEIIFLKKLLIKISTSRNCQFIYGYV